jgi:hypothetical protein
MPASSNSASGGFGESIGSGGGIRSSAGSSVSRLSGDSGGGKFGDFALFLGSGCSSGGSRAGSVLSSRSGAPAESGAVAAPVAAASVAVAAAADLVTLHLFVARAAVSAVTVAGAAGAAAAVVAAASAVGVESGAVAAPVATTSVATVSDSYVLNP